MLAQVPKSVDVIFKCWTFGKLVTLELFFPLQSRPQSFSYRFGQEFFFMVLLDWNA